eukprot:Gb_30177 [translate_table: standard]
MIEVKEQLKPRLIHNARIGIDQHVACFGTCMTCSILIQRKVPNLSLLNPMVGNDISGRSIQMVHNECHGAHSYASSDHPASPLQASYACEDVSHYYSFLEDLEGTKLMEKLHNIVSGHHSLPYVQVWDALEVLDAVDFEHPKDSPNVLEIYSLRAVPKLLAGKPEGWNSEFSEYSRRYALMNMRSHYFLKRTRYGCENAQEKIISPKIKDRIVQGTYCSSLEVKNHRFILNIAYEVNILLISRFQYIEYVM